MTVVTVVTVVAVGERWTWWVGWGERVRRKFGKRTLERGLIWGEATRLRMGLWR